MPRDDRVFSVLVACPSDVQEEAGLVRRAVEEINLGFAPLQAARLEVVDWQTHTSPGIGSDAQDVINRQLPDDYDIFLGVMWARIGTPTPRAESGTEEEFEGALTRHKNGPGSVRILFYFKQKSLALDAINPSQLQKVKEFRERLKQEGVRYGDFYSSSEFERDVRRDLTRELRALVAAHRKDDGDSAGALEEGRLEQEAEEEGEFGLLDYLDRAEERFEQSRIVTGRMSARIRDVGDRMRERTAEIEAATSGGKKLSRAEARALFGKAAEDMDRFSEDLGNDLPTFRDTLAGAVMAVREAALLHPAGPNRDDELREGVRLFFVDGFLAYS